MNTEQEKFQQRVVLPNLSVNSGVYAALDHNISMQLNEYGAYEYVGLDQALTHHAKDILQISAFGGEGPVEGEIAKSLFGDKPESKFHPVVGYYAEIFAGWATDPNIRLNASSGGITTWLLIELLKLGLIDGVIHMKTTGTGNKLFEYQISYTEDEIQQGAKTRYYPGELSQSLKEIQLLEGKFALVAIPSIVYEVRLLQNLDRSYRSRIPYIIGLICGHQKTANYADYLAWQMGVKPGSLKSIDFRKKIEGLPANSYSTEITGEINGELQTKVAQQNELVGTDWGLGFFKSNFSDFTEDALNECADIVIGDAWLPQYTADSRGTNIIVIRNPELLAVFDTGKNRKEIHLDPLETRDLLKSQTSLIRQNVEEIHYRLNFLKKHDKNTPINLRRPSSGKISLLRRAIQQARIETSRTSHSAYLTARKNADLNTFHRIMRRPSMKYRNLQRAAKLQKKLLSRIKK